MSNGAGEERVMPGVTRESSGPDLEDRAAEELRLRAAELARPLQGEATSAVHAVAVMAVGAEQIGIPTTFLREIVPMPRISEVPGSHLWISGIAQLRGELFAVIDLALLLGLEGRGEGRSLAIVDGPQGPLGLMVDAVIGFCEVDAAEMTSGSTAAREGWIQVLTRDMVAILDMERLLASERLVVGPPLSQSASAARAD